MHVETTPNAQEQFKFLSDGGEMGALTRAKDWNTTSLGTPQHWPQSLRTTLSIILSSKFPMFLWWGTELIQFYNDAYRPSLGNEGKHPTALGQRGEECWQEIWYFIKPIIDQVLAGGEASWHEDQLLPIYRNGKLEDVYWTFSYSPVKDESGKINGVLVVCTETTKQITTAKRLKAIDEKFRNTVKQAPVGITILRGEDFNVEMANSAYLQLVDKHEEEFVGKPLYDSLPEVKVSIDPWLKGVMQTGIPFNGYEFEVTLNRFGKKEQAYFNFVYHPLKDTNDVINGIMVVATDVTKQVENKLALVESERRFRNTVKQAPIGIVIMRGSQYIVEMANNAYLQLVDRTEEQFIGKPILDSLPEVQDTVKPLLDNVYHTETPFYGYAINVPINRFGKTESCYFDFVYHPLRDDNGQISGIMAVVTDVTKQTETKFALEESELQFRNLVAQSPIPMAIFRGEELIIELGNEVMLKTLWHKKLEEVQGKKLLDVFPELRDQKFPDLLNQVFKTGKAYKEHEALAILSTPNGLKNHYLDFEYAPLRDPDHSISGIMVTVTDVTEKVDARQLIKLSAERLRLATEGAQIATWDLDLKTREIIYSGQLATFFGYPETHQMTHQEMRDHIHPEDIHTVVEKAFEDAMHTGIYQYEARAIQPDQSIRWIRTIGKVFFDEQQVPYRMLGTMMDISERKRSEKILERSEKKFRTLSDSMPQHIWTGEPDGTLTYFNQSVYDYSGLTPKQVEEGGWLQIVHPDDKEDNIKQWIESVTTGKPFLFEHRFRRHDGEYRWQLSRAIPQKDEEGNILMWVGTSTDIHDSKLFIDELEQRVLERTKQLHKLNQDLSKSNDDLAQFAYVASHDLQEPLRKIQTFATRIIEIENDTLSQKGKDYFARIQASSSRMQQLILDLLSYSRVNAGKKHLEKVDLNSLVKKVQEQLKEALDQKKAILHVSALPQIQAIPFQFDQLFTNLISNALKFSNSEVPPVITIRADYIPGSLLNSPNSDPTMQYHRLSVSDNGIGFEPEYSERIFQVFQRLHGKEEYEGTGIGLSIVKKIVENHHGIIRAESQPGKGTTFSIYIPFIQ